MPGEYTPLHNQNQQTIHEHSHIYLQKRSLTYPVAVPVCSNRFIEKTIERPETDRSDILITLLQLTNDPRDLTSRLWRDTNPWFPDIAS